MGAYDAVRKMFAASDVSKLRGYTASTFSFNVEGGAAIPAAAMSRCILEK